MPGVTLSPDGTRAAGQRVDPVTLAGTAIWFLDFARNDTLTRMTSGSFRHFDPVWSPAGDRVAYVSSAGDQVDWKPSGGSGASEVVLPPNGKQKHLNDWSGDGRLLLFSEQDEKTKFDLWVAPVDGDRKPGILLNSEFNETQGQFSPDGRWIAYVSDETGQPQVYLQPFPLGAGGSGKIAVSSDGGLMPRWRRDGKELFYVRVDAGIAASVMAVDFTSATGRTGLPRELFRVSGALWHTQAFMWDVAPAGDRFLLHSIPDTPVVDAPLTVVLNWQLLLEK
jgi:Tol biopolymer transport system component